MWVGSGFIGPHGEKLHFWSVSSEICSTSSCFGSVEIERALPIDHTPTIKSVRAYKTREVFSFSLRNNVPLPRDWNPFYNYSCNNFLSWESYLYWKHKIITENQPLTGHHLYSGAYSRKIFCLRVHPYSRCLSYLTTLSFQPTTVCMYLCNWTTRHTYLLG